MDSTGDPLANPGAAQTRPAPPSTRDFLVRFSELTRIKGAYLKTGLGADFCRRLGVRPVGDCEVFAARFLVEGRPAVAFYSLDDGRTGVPRIFVTNLLEPGVRDDYNIDLDGRLQRAVRRRGDISSHLAVIESTQALERTLSFLRARFDEIASWPDAVLRDDGSCPKDQLRRIAVNSAEGRGAASIARG